ncbi:MAG: hypothetical protein ACR2NW_02165 [Thermodesulfobacteriota bacterium]
MENKEIKIQKFLNVLLITFLILTLFSCATTKEVIDITTDTIGGLDDKFVRSIRKPGEKQVETEEKTSLIYGCNNRKEGEIFIEKIEIVPNRLKRGEEINQRLRYAACPGFNNKSLNGTVKRVIRHNGKTVFEDFTKYDFKPGTWNIDVFILVPRESSVGRYEFINVINYGTRSVTKINSFTVKA